MESFGLTLGFHGCDRKIGGEILSGRQKHLKVSTNSYDWLGSGAYFWENDADRALKWVRLVKKNSQDFRQKIEEPFVLGAIIDLGLCLDLTRASCLDEIRLPHQSMASFLRETEIPMPVNTPGFRNDFDLVKRHLDCATVNFVHQLRLDPDNPKPAYDTVRGPFTEGRPLYKGAKIMDKTHIQICIRNPRASIRGYFRLL
ncbi:MAG: hypothetical protein R3F13_02885 [Prosthecobacter sp.]